MHEVLNPILYESLCRKFKNAGGVLIASQGIKNIWRKCIYKGRPSRELVLRGENYRVNCPWCDDIRFRCYVSYEFGVIDGLKEDEQYGDHLTLIRCYNEECFMNMPERKQAFFYEILYGRPVTKAHIRPGIVRPAGVYTPPGETVALHELPPLHPVVTYLTGRGFDIYTLSHIYKFAWCMNSSFRGARSRLIIPVFSEDKPVGWLARAIDGVTPQIADKMPKYFNMPGFQSQRQLYSWDLARKHKTIVLVEGSLDAIRVGSPAVGLFGKSLSTHNLDRISSWANANEATIVVALDPDKPLNDKQSRHHIEVVADKLRRTVKNVLPFYLPAGTDPGETERNIFKALLYEEAAKQKINLDFSFI